MVRPKSLNGQGEILCSLVSAKASTIMEKVCSFCFIMSDMPDFPGSSWSLAVFPDSLNDLGVGTSLSIGSKMVAMEGNIVSGSVEMLSLPNS